MAKMMHFIPPIVCCKKPRPTIILKKEKTILQAVFMCKIILHALIICETVADFY